MLKKILHTNRNNWTLLLPRLTIGVIMAAHGAQKLFGWFGGGGLKGSAHYFAEALGLTPGILWATLAGCGEFFGGLFLLFGLLTRLGALSIAIVMAVAMCTAMRGSFFLPSGIEYTLMLFTVALALLFSGGGACSVDGALANRNQK